jgi:rhamnogalacturonan endolyase
MRVVSLAGKLIVACLSFFVCLPSVEAGFGLTSSEDFFTVDTGSGLVFKVRRVDNGSNTQSVGDIASLTYNGKEYQNQLKGSHVNSGFDWLYSNTSSVSVSASTINSDFIKVTVDAGDLTHYYLARKGYPHIYMGTYFTKQPDNDGYVRYIYRLSSDLLPYSPKSSDLRGQVAAVEASDVFAMSNGETRSKHYFNHRMKDWRFFGASNDYVGMWIVKDNQEGGTGGPFYRSLKLQTTPTNQELTYYVNYGHAQTEAYRTGVLNSYTFVVTDGREPTARVDTSWFDGMGLKGYVSPSVRGRVAGVGIKNRDPNYEYTVGFASDKAQYWVDADSETGYYSSTNMRPGNYTLTVYKNELAVYTGRVTVRAGQTTVLHSIYISEDPSDDQAIWRIGDWDGTPHEFLNGDKLTTMHPSDPRMESWDIGNFIIGSSDDSTFPGYMWKDINNDHIVYFKLNPSQLAQSQTLRIGITCAYSGGRPLVSVNDWVSALTSSSRQPKTRSLTTGTYRGNNVTYHFDVPASAWKQNSGEWNVLKVSVISGSGLSGFLSAGMSVDSIDLIGND